LIIIFSCKKEKATLSLKGKIYNNSSQELIENATISIDNQKVQTNKNGEFVKTDLKTNNEYFIKIEHPDYVSIIRKVKYTILKDITTNFPLIPRNPAQKFNASDSIIATLNEGSSIEVQPNSFITKDGSQYNGEVIIRATFINPQNNNSIISSPSTFISSDSLPLQTFGMMEIYATSSKGERLEIKGNKPIKVKIPNITGLTANTGLYSLNMENGSWIKKGEFRFDNNPTNTLSGLVTSISSAWNADNPCSNSLVCIRVLVVDNSHAPRPGYFIGAKGLTYLGYTGLFQTDANGYVNLNICPGETFKFVGDIIPCCDGHEIPGSPEHIFCCVNGGQIQGPMIDMSTVTLTPPCTFLGEVVMNP